MSRSHGSDDLPLFRDVPGAVPPPAVRPWRATPADTWGERPPSSADLERQSPDLLRRNLEFLRAMELHGEGAAASEVDRFVERHGELIGHLVRGRVDGDAVPEHARLALEAVEELAGLRRRILGRLDPERLRQVLAAEARVRIRDVEIERLLRMAEFELAEERGDVVSMEMPMRESELEPFGLIGRDMVDGLVLEFAERMRAEQEERPLPARGGLRTLLRNVPVQWLDATWDALEPGPERPRRRKDRERELAARLLERETLSRVVGEKLSSRERRLLAYLVERNGQVAAAAVTRRFGSDAGDGWFWDEQPPTSVLGRLRLYGLAFVGAAPDGSADRTVVVPRELRPVLEGILEEHPDLEEHVDTELYELVAQVTEDVWGMPVRLMEAVLERGAAAVEPVLAELDRAMEADEEEALNPLWPLVLLGELGDARGVPALVEVMSMSARHDLDVLSSAAAEALARIGPASLGALPSLLERGGPEERTWAYATVGWIRHDEAYGLLVEALESDPELADVVATALADQGRREAIPVLHAALGVVEPWQRMELESAIVALHHGEGGEGSHRQDWRLRYRLSPSLGAILPAWPTFALIARKHDALRQRRVVAVRELEEILADPLEEDEAELCDCCGAPVFHATGVPACPATAAGVAVIQRSMLGAYGAELETDDLFDVLDVMELELWEFHHDEPEPRSRKARQGREDRLTELEMVRASCAWLVERGVESVAEGRALLLAEARRLADDHGDPESLLGPDVVGPRSTPAVAPDRVGRNDPCPCGSGRKYKRCCGRHPQT